MRLPNTTWYPAHPSNYTKGRNRAITKFTVHHTAANNTTLRHLWGNPERNGSSTLFVAPGVREQYVSLNDTPWTNTNFRSNSESITCEVTGDWRFGYYNASTLKELTEVMYQCLKIYPHLKLEFHKDVADRATLCPADLKDKGYAQTCWNNAKERIIRETTVKPSITYKPIKKKIILTRTANLWNFNFTKWADAKSVGSYPAGHVVDVVAQATNQLGAKYYMTDWSYNSGKIRATNGFNVADTKTYVPAAPVPVPPKEPTPPPVVPEPEPPIPPEKYPSWFVEFIKDLIDWFKEKLAIK